MIDERIADGVPGKWSLVDKKVLVFHKQQSGEGFPNIRPFRNYPLNTAMKSETVRSVMMRSFSTLEANAKAGVTQLYS